MIAGGATEVGTPRTATDESIIFQIDEDFTIPRAAPGGLRRAARAAQVKNVGVADGDARPQGADQLAFGTPPQVGDALYLGFERAAGPPAARRSTSTPRRPAAPA